MAVVCGSSRAIDQIGSLIHIMKKKPPIKSETPVFPQTMHRVRPNPEEHPVQPKVEKRDNIFSQSKDIHEDRSERQMKTTHNPETFHGRSV